MILPPSILANHEALKLYEDALNTAKFEAEDLIYTYPEFKNCDYYVVVAGNTLNVATTINARELETFIRLRSCNRAQWEVRNIALGMLNTLRAIDSRIFSGFGPACCTTGVCPEGRLSCGKCEETKERFAQHKGSKE